MHTSTIDRKCIMPARLARLAMLCLAWLAQVATAAAQADVHYQFDGFAPPGAVGSWRLLRGGPVPGYFQPVEIIAPEGVSVALAADGRFCEPQATPINVGLLIAPVYRLRVIGIPNELGRELYPTVELIDRVYPPVGQERRFPIPIEITADDLRLAIEGRFVTRVVYLEEPDSALPYATEPNHPEWYDVGPHHNPLQVADQLGRPVAILRIGSRLPDDRTGPDMQFLGNCPPFTVFQPFVMTDEGVPQMTPPVVETAPPPAIESRVVPTAFQAPAQPTGRLFPWGGAR